jgi:hypothetical protein
MTIFTPALRTRVARTLRAAQQLEERQMTSVCILRTLMFAVRRVTRGSYMTDSWSEFLGIASSLQLGSRVRQNAGGNSMPSVPRFLANAATAFLGIARMAVKA